MPPSPAPVRLRHPEDMIGAIPHLLGFVPSSSLVVMFLEASGSAGLTARFDLPDDNARETFVALVSATARRSGARAVALVVWVDEPARGTTVHGELVGAIGRALDDIDCVLQAAMLVDGERYWNYLCDEPCCPAAGVACPDALTRAAAQVAARAVLAGRVLAPRREHLAERIGFDTATAPPDIDAVFDRVDNDYVQRLLVTGSRDAQHVTEALLGRAVLLRLRQCDSDSSAYAARWARGRHFLASLVDRDGLTVEGTARLAVGLRDQRARDAVATHCLDVPPPLLLDVVCEVARRTPDAYAGPVCSLAAWIAYITGDGAMTNVALDRSLACEPESDLAQMLRHAMLEQLSPATLRRMLETTRRDLERAPTPKPNARPTSRR